MKKFRWHLLVVSVLSLPLVGSAGDPPPVQVGETAPDFLLPAATKDTLLFQGIRLSDAVGNGPVILAFYPADWSGGCTTEMCSFRDQILDLGTLGAAVYGISGDYVFSHREWARHLNLPFTLLSDHDHAVAKRYSSYNAKTGMNLRTVFLVTKEGKIAYIDLAFRAGSEDSYTNLQSAVSALVKGK